MVSGTRRFLLPSLFATLLSLLATGTLSAQVMVSTLTDPFNGSGGVAVGPDGQLYVGDFGIRLNNPNGATIKRIALDGTVSTFAGLQLGASGNDFDAQGNFYQSNIAGNRIQKVTPDGTVSTFATGITSPVGLVMTDSGSVFVTNCTNPGAIQTVTPAGVVSTFVRDSLLACPNGLTMDDAGNLYTCNFGNGWVVKITPDGTVSNLVEIPGGFGSNGNNGHITFANNRLYVVARCANRIYEVSLAGQLTLLAGSGQRGNGDGPALQATFSIPNGIRASRSGDTLFVNDAVPQSGGCFSGDLNPVVIRMITGLNAASPIEDRQPSAPAGFLLDPPYPNPFNPETRVAFSVETAEWVNLTVFGLGGREVAVLVDGRVTAGTHTVRWNGHDDAGQAVASGTYLMRLRAGGQTAVRRAVLVR